MASAPWTKEEVGDASSEDVVFLSTLIHMLSKASGLPLVLNGNFTFARNNLLAHPCFTNKEYFFITLKIDWFYSPEHSGGGGGKPVHAEGVFMGKNSEHSDSSESNRETEK